MTENEMATALRAYLKKHGPTDESVLTAYVNAIHRMTVEGELARMAMAGEVVGMPMADGQYTFKLLR